MTCKYPVESRSYKACVMCSDKNSCDNSTVTCDSTYLLSAIQAYHKTKEYLKTCSTKELVEINKRISDAIAEGKFAVSGDGCLQPETRLKLEELGYKVLTGTQYNESYWTIVWNLKKENILV